MMVTIDYFRRELLAKFIRGSAILGSIDVLINAGEFHRSLGGYPGSCHGMAACCDAMQGEIRDGDTVVLERVNGAGMTVRYRLPRTLH